ncbi:MAG: DUF5060 domain-containing protein [Planctomycetes bacterium]|nr:DUF5060 domain-containing protein [Planctomycetota bacterium]
MNRTTSSSGGRCGRVAGGACSVRLVAAATLVAALGVLPAAGARGAPADPAGMPAGGQAAPQAGAGAARVEGSLRQWHKVALALAGPFARETDSDPNPFTDYRLSVVFRHESGAPEYRAAGYFAADGRAAHTSAEAGSAWRVHLAPDKPGRWTYRVSFVKGRHVALDASAAGQPVPGLDGLAGAFDIAPTDKAGRDLRGKGRLQYVGKHHLQFAGTGEYFLKAGADAPETLLAFADFDGTWSRKKADAPRRQGEAAPAGLHRYEPHLKDWRPGDPAWKDGKGRGLIGALNYLAGKGCNAVSFLTYNAGGDGDNVWPFVAPDDKFHYDCSKLDQWQIVFDHAQAVGLYLHFKMQETENDDNVRGQKEGGRVPEALDGGDLGPERKLYCRELVARFGYALALGWNLGEENTQTPGQQRAMAQYIHDIDPYRHPIVVHTYPNWQDRVYPPLLGKQSVLAGASLQNSWSQAHQRTLKWVAESAKAGRPWVVANDEQNPADMGVPPDPGYAGHDGKAVQGAGTYDLHDIRKFTLWGTLMAGGAGVEYYFGYKLPQNDLGCEDWRSRQRSWDYCRVALEFFRAHKVPFWEMKCADELVGNEKNDNSRYCLARPGEVYVVYLPGGGTADLDLADHAGAFDVFWYNPRSGGDLARGSVREVKGPGKASIGRPPAGGAPAGRDSPAQATADDWTILVRRPPAR